MNERGDFAESPLKLRQSLLRESLALYEQVHGREHPLIAEVLNDLAFDPFLTDEEAEEYARAALAMRRKLLKPQDMELADSLVQLGDVLRRQTNKTVMAEAAYLEALTIRTNLLRPETLAVAMVYASLAELQEMRGDFVAAELSQRHAALARGPTTFVNLVGVSFRLRLASMLHKRGALLEAGEQCRQALKLSADCLPDFPDASAGPHYQMVVILSEEGNLPEAETHAREFLALYGRRHPTHWKISDCHSKLGGVLLRQKKYAEAEPLLISGYEGLKSGEDESEGVINLRLTEACERLVQLYTAWDKPAEAAEWKKKLVEPNGVAAPKPSRARKDNQ